jgi:hypothetical protein
MTGPVNCPVTGSYIVHCFPWWHTPAMAEIKVGYARVSTDEQDLTVQRDALAAMGVEPDRIYVDHGLTGSNTNRPGLREALAACRGGDTFMVTKLDRLARSVRDAHQIADDLAARGVKLSIDGSLHDPADPIGKLLFNVLAWWPSSRAISSAPAPARPAAWETAKADG